MGTGRSLAVGLALVGVGVLAACGEDPRLLARRSAGLTVPLLSAPGVDGGPVLSHAHWSAGSVLLDRRADWWDAGWQYRVRMDVTADGGADGFPMLVEADLDSVLAPESLDVTSVRLVDPLNGGQEVPSAFDVGQQAAHGTLLFALDLGGAPVPRPYAVYFDSDRHGTKGLPPYQTSTAAASTGNAELTFGGLGRGASNEQNALGFNALTFAGAGVNPDTVWARHLSLISSDGSYCSELQEEGVQLCATAMTPGTRLELLSTPALTVHRLTAVGGALGLRQYTLSPPGHAVRIVLQVENQGSAAVTGGKLFDGIDFDLGADPGDDSASWQQADQVMVTADGPATVFVGIRPEPAPTHLEVVDGNVWPEVDAGQLDDATDAGPGDVECALQLAIPDLAPGQTWVFGEAWGAVATDYPSLRDALVRMSEPPPSRLSSVEGPFEDLGGYQSAVVDLGGTQVSDLVVRWSAVVPDGGSLQVGLRSGTSPDPASGGWAAFTPVAQSGDTVPSPARFVQLRASFAAAAALEAPVELTALELEYTPVTGADAGSNAESDAGTDGGLPGPHQYQVGCQGAPGTPLPLWAIAGLAAAGGLLRRRRD